MRYREIIETKTTWSGKPFPGLTPEFIALVKRVRHACRIDNGGGGACHLVSEWLHDKFGWERFSGAYLGTDGEVIDAGHLWNYLPDGSILDATADQLGEGDDIRVIAPSDPAYKRYRPEWSLDYNPGMSEYDASRPTPHSVENWNGEEDYDRADRLKKERGPLWHVTDMDQWNAYSRDQWEKYGHDNWAWRGLKKPDDLRDPEKHDAVDYRDLDEDTIGESSGRRSRISL